MICGIRLRLDPASIRVLLCNPEIELEQKVNLVTGELKFPITWEEEGITIKLNTPTYGILKGSLHKYKNAGQHNFDDFTMKEVYETSSMLSNRIGIQIEELELIKLEWGFNIQLNRSPLEILTRLVSHKNVEFKKLYVHPGNHYVCHHHNFDFKVYDKSAQYATLSSAPKNTIRVECSTNHARLLHQIGINTLRDLEHEHVQIDLFEYLTGIWSEILFIEPELEQYANESAQVHKWSNPRFWNSLSRQQRHREKNRYQKFINSKELDFQEEFYYLMYNKLIKMRHLQD